MVINARGRLPILSPASDDGDRQLCLSRTSVGSDEQRRHRITPAAFKSLDGHQTSEDSVSACEGTRSSIRFRSDLARSLTLGSFVMALAVNTRQYDFDSALKPFVRQLQLLLCHRVPITSSYIVR